MTTLAHGGNVMSCYGESTLETGEEEKHCRTLLPGMIIGNQELKWQAALIQSAHIQDCLPHVLVAKRQHLTLMELT